MKKLFYFFLLTSVVFVNAEKFVIDKIEAIIFGHEDTLIITKSDVERLTLDGAFRTVDDVILEQLMFQEAKKYKITPDENAINRYLEGVQRENNLSQNDLKAMFSAAGYTYEEGRAQLGIMFAVNSIMDFKIRSRLIVMERDVQAYFDDHPVYQEAAYLLKRGIVSFDDSLSRKEQKKKIENQLRAGRSVVGAVWSEPFWINKADIAAEKQFLFKMKPKTMSKPIEVATGFELFFVVDLRKRQLVSLEERYQDIANTLRKPRYEELFEKFKKELYEASSIVRM